MSRRYEVTVPVVVTITVGDDGVPRGTWCTIDRGYPGFFGDAEESAGVWYPAEEEWGTDDDTDDDAGVIASTAWAHVRRYLLATVEGEQ